MFTKEILMKSKIFSKRALCISEFNKSRQHYNEEEKERNIRAK